MNGAMGRYTARGGPEVEKTLDALSQEVAGIVEKELTRKDYRALVLLGGYGRGEGGVEVRDGRERPHNNADYLLILERSAGSRRSEIKTALDQELEAVVDRFGIGVDLTTITTSKLGRSPCLVMWYDMRFGHKTILGDPDFVPGLRRFSAQRILASDVLNLLVNRGTLLLLNRALLERGTESERDRRNVIKHGAKAIIGYGDALLFSLGAYHWSYREKARRMEARTDVPRAFQRLYLEAASFRLQPRYESFRSCDLAGWNESIIADLEPIHLAFEGARLRRPGLDWESYPHLALESSSTDDLFVPRRLARKILNGLGASRAPDPVRSSLKARLGFRMAGQAGLLPLVFPMLAYGPSSPEKLGLARAFLDTDAPDRGMLTHEYLLRWGRFGDVNFLDGLRHKELNLTMKEAA